jgi:hypothetical protein
MIVQPVQYLKGIAINGLAADAVLGPGDYARLGQIIFRGWGNG